jgi:hypothetical protein
VRNGVLGRRGGRQQIFKELLQRHGEHLADHFRGGGKQQERHQAKRGQAAAAEVGQPDDADLPAKPPAQLFRAADVELAKPPAQLFRAERRPHPWSMLL